jgi:hypothetical protein
MKEGFLDEVFEKKSKTADRIGPALVKTGIAASGGLIAGRIDAVASDHWPKSAVAGPFLVALVSIALRVFADGKSALENVAQEIAAGMAGWIGDDLWYLLRNFLGLGFKKWEPNKDYGKGAQIKYEGKLYRSSREVKGSTATPDKDPSWVLIEGRAQGFRSADLVDFREFAQALADDKERWQATAIDTLNRIGPLIEEATGTEFSDGQKASLVNHMTEVSAAVDPRVSPWRHWSSCTSKRGSRAAACAGLRATRRAWRKAR